MRSQIGKEDNVSKQINQLNKELRTIYTENSDEALVVYFTRSYQKAIEQLSLGCCWYHTDLWSIEMTLNNIDMTATM